MAGGPRAVLFDCDGVIADSEPLHLRAFQEALAPLGITITPTEYAERYLGFDDRGVFTEALRLHGRPVDPATIASLMTTKAVRFRGVLETEVRIYPGVVEFVRTLAGLPLAVVSGALREEIEIILRHAGVRDAFSVIVGAEDVQAGKPDPDGFLRGLAALSGAARAIAPADCLVVEDSLAGLEAATRAGMRRLAVTNSYPAAELRVVADLVVPTLAGLTLAGVRRLFA
jgi:HAD superfamily hydrolase (TIGR01509 family)